MSERIIIEYRSGSEWEGFLVTVAATVSEIETFTDALGEVVKEVYEAHPGRSDADLEVDGVILSGFPVKGYLEDSLMCEVCHLDEWFEKNELDNSSEARRYRLCGVVSPSS